MNFTKLDKDYYTTSILQDMLKNCIGRSTVEIFNCSIDNKICKAIYHYNALIAVYDYYNDLIILNYRFFDYSASTSRVRNAFIRYAKGDEFSSVPLTKQLQKIENTGEVITDNILNYTVFELNNSRG